MRKKKKKKKKFDDKFKEPESSYFYFRSSLKGFIDINTSDNNDNEKMIKILLI